MQPRSPPATRYDPPMPPRPHPRTVILLGYRGSGKSSVGRALADRLGVPFIDTDPLVLEAFGGRSVREVWDNEGEPAFRAVEGRVVADVLGTPGRVVGLGGGTINESPAAHEAVERCEALRVYLRAPAAVLAARIEGDATSAALRPSLTGKAGAATEVAEVLARREPVYLQVADAVIDTAGVSIDDIVAAIMRELEVADTSDTGDD